MEIAAIKPAFAGKLRNTSAPSEYLLSIFFCSFVALNLLIEELSRLNKEMASQKVSMNCPWDEDSIMSSRTKSCAIWSLRFNSLFLDENINRSSTTSSVSYWLASKFARRRSSFELKDMYSPTVSRIFDISG